MSDIMFDQIKEYCNNTAAAMTLRRARYHAWMAKRLREVRCTAVEDLPFEADEAIKTIRPEKRACYGNALQVALLVEGHVVFGYYVAHDLGLPMLHAWCEKDGHHFDPTVEYALGKAVSDYSYGEIARMKARDYMTLHTELPFNDLIFGYLYEQEQKKSHVSTS